MRNGGGRSGGAEPRADPGVCADARAIAFSRAIVRGLADACSVCCTFIRSCAETCPGALGDGTRRDSSPGARSDGTRHDSSPGAPERGASERVARWADACTGRRSGAGCAARDAVCGSLLAAGRASARCRRQHLDLPGAPATASQDCARCRTVIARLAGCLA